MQWPPRPGPGLERHEAERLRRRRVHDLPDVDPHPVAELRELVDERDVDRAEDVLEELRQLRGLGRRDAVHRLDRRAVERGRGVGRRVVDPADHLRDGLRRPVDPARVDALGREGEVEVPSGDEARLALEHGQELLPRRPRVRRRLEHDEVTRRAGDGRSPRPRRGRSRDRARAASRAASAARSGSRPRRAARRSRSSRRGGRP